MECGHLVKHFSKQKTAGRASVNYIEAKYVKKEAGLAPGQVILKKIPKSINVIASKEIIDKLLLSKKKIKETVKKT